jgi:transmembrane sensor
MITIDNLTDLLMKHLQGSLSDGEQEQLGHWLEQSGRNRRLFESINDEEQLRQQVLLYHREGAEDNEAIILSKIRQQLSNDPVIPVRKIHTLRRWMSAAAIALVLAGIGGYFLLNRKKDAAPVVVKTATTANIPPGRDGAILTLADGRKVVLDSLGNGVIATQSGTQVELKNGALAYNRDAGSTAPVYNNLTTPKGRQFQLILPDGTRVWLNAASSLRYPTAFAGKERQVEVTGEAYFEVAHDKTKPFIVNIPSTTGGSEGSRIEVLGTHFNINAYDNEQAIKTTLLEGSVRVTQNADRGTQKAKTVILKPGQQAVLKAYSPLAVNYSPDLDKAIAWKNGFFNFEDASLEEVMRQLERWYDIEVVYEKNIPDIQFGGKMSNDVSLSGLLKSLQEMEVHFRIEGRKLIVLP